MHIKRVLDQNRRDITAVFACEHCGHEHEKYGYDDEHFHRKVVPAMECPSCGRKQESPLRPMGTRYPDAQVV